MNEDLDPQDRAKIEALVCDLKVIRESRCSACGAAVCGHESLMSLTMGFKNDPKCWTCLADAMGHGKEALRDHIFAYIQHRPCHHEGWLWADREEGFEPGSLPRCLWPDHSAAKVEQPCPLPQSLLNEKLVSDADYDFEWDAGGIGCGDLVLELRIRLQSLKPGRVLKLIATDSGAPEDLPAWCRMTGNTLIAFYHPVYLIQRKSI
jgi:tRNA 2-thiouridine synthesizing protein A